MSLINWSWSSDSSSGEDYLSVKSPLAIGYCATALLVLGLGSWATFTTISGSVVASGIVEVKSNQQVVQHMTGGIVSEILVRDGDRVEAGQVLLKLDPSSLKSDFITVNNQLHELTAQKYRLIAERDEEKSLSYPDDFMKQVMSSYKLAMQVRGQRLLFEAGEESFSKEISQLEEQRSQLNRQIIGIQAEIDSHDSQIKIVSTELENKRKLLKKKLITSSAIAELEIRQTSLTGARSKFESQIAQLKGNIINNDIEITRLKTKKRKEAISALQNIEPKIVELAQRRQKLETELERLEIKSPVDGVVHGSKVVSLNSVVQAAEPLMFVVPQAEPMVINVKVDTADRSQINDGQEVALKFPTFSERTMPDILGNVDRISANTYTDSNLHWSYYLVEISPQPGELEKLGNSKLLPGMPVEAFLRTKERTPLSFLLSPLLDFFDKSFRGR